MGRCVLATRTFLTKPILHLHLQAQRLLAAGQIDQEVDIDDGCATKKHKVRCSPL